MKGSLIPAALRGCPGRRGGGERRKTGGAGGKPAKHAPGCVARRIREGARHRPPHYYSTDRPKIQARHEPLVRCVFPSRWASFLVGLKLLVVAWVLAIPQRRPTPVMPRITGVDCRDDRLAGLLCGQRPRPRVHLDPYRRSQPDQGDALRSLKHGARAWSVRRLVCRHRGGEPGDVAGGWPIRPRRG